MRFRSVNLGDVFAHRLAVGDGPGILDGGAPELLLCELELQRADFQRAVEVKLLPVRRVKHLVRDEFLDALLQLGLAHRVGVVHDECGRVDGKETEADSGGAIHILGRLEMVGVGATLVVVDEGFSKSFTTSTVRKAVYGFFFHQKGLMAGLGLQGWKITRLRR